MRRAGGIVATIGSLTGFPMKPLIRPLAALACCLLLLGACRDKHDPVKPTVAATAIAP